MLRANGIEIKSSGLPHNLPPLRKADNADTECHPKNKCILFCSIVSVVGRAAAIQDALFYFTNKYGMKNDFVSGKKNFLFEERISMDNAYIVFRQKSVS